MRFSGRPTSLLVEPLKLQMNEKDYERTEYAPEAEAVNEWNERFGV